LALLNFARFCGFEYLGKDKDKNMMISYMKNGEKVVEKYELLEVLEFNSTRKRMSVILLDHTTGKILLYSKGADNILLERMKRPVNKQEETWEHLTKYANTGLRTLAVASREIPQQEYESWYKLYKKSKVALKKRKQKMMDV
jgi:P-type E1-E2 ATPase